MLSWTNTRPASAALGEKSIQRIPMAKLLIHCNELFPGCSFVAHGEDETTVLIDAAHHLTAKHDVRDIDQELLKKARAAMRETQVTSP